MSILNSSGANRALESTMILIGCFFAGAVGGVTFVADLKLLGKAGSGSVFSRRS